MILLVQKASKKLQNTKAIKIAICGSYGKTSTREVMLEILQATGKKVKAATENHNTPFGIYKFVESLESDEEILIFEFGEYFPGDIKFLCEMVKPDIGVITGINEAHLEKFKNIEKTTLTIFEISDYLKDKNVHVNIDNKYVSENMRSENVPFSVNGVGYLSKKFSKASLEGLEFNFDVKGKNYNFYTQLIGEHYLSAIFLGIFLALEYGGEIGEVKKSVERLKPFKNRLELKKLGENIFLLDDSYNGNIDGFLATLNFLKNIYNRRILYITPGLVETGNKTKELHSLIGKKIVESGIKNVILIRNSVTPFIEKSMKENAFQGNIQYVENMNILLSGLSSVILDGDLVVIQNDWGDQYY